MHAERLNLRSSTAARNLASHLIGAGKPFSNSTGNLRGFPGRPSTFGWLSQENRAKFPDKGVTYTIMSYDTPLAWRLEDGSWVMPKASYSPTTGKQQSIVRGLLAGLKVAA
jgi:hypothetical protein